jgi:hypothetical protein
MPNILSNFRIGKNFKTVHGYLEIATFGNQLEG